MKFSFCLMLTIAAGCSTNDPSTNNLSKPIESNDSNTSSPNSAPNDMDGKFVIDVRTQAEWDSGHVERAIHIPHGEIANRINEVTSDKNAEIVVYCAAGSRAGRAKVALEQLGFTNVENAGGYDDIKQHYE
jgi:phage shock protein E